MNELRVTNYDIWGKIPSRLIYYYLSDSFDTWENFEYTKDGHDRIEVKIMLDSEISINHYKKNIYAVFGQVGSFLGAAMAIMKGMHLLLIKKY